VGECTRFTRLVTSSTKCDDVKGVWRDRVHEPRHITSHLSRHVEGMKWQEEGKEGGEGGGVEEGFL
jgi:hypothetical protein